jgi:uncharacterized protein (TIGR02687 family)
MSKIEESIQKLFTKHRVLVWYDGEQSFGQEYAEIDLPGITKIDVNNNELAVKYRLYMEEPNSKFLLYLPKERPEDTDNWLLDVELAYHVYHTDEQALFLQELGLEYHLKEWVSKHLDFFRNKLRLQRLAALVSKDDTATMLTVKMMQVVFGAELPELDIFIRQYATAFVQDKHTAIDKELERFNLQETFWNSINKRFAYTNSSPGIYDFLVAVFSKNYSLTAAQNTLNKETAVLLSNWKDAKSFEDTFRKLSEKIQADLDIETKLNKGSIDDVLDDDLFEKTDQRIISELVPLVITDAIDYKRLDTVLKRRESKYWCDTYRFYYKAIEEAFLLLQFIRKNEDVKLEEFHAGMKLYADQFYEADQRYRKFIEYFRLSNQSNVLSVLYKHIDKAYTNSWLLPLSDSWQKVLDQQSAFPYRHERSLRQFFKGDVQPFIEKKSKVFIIISDAFRYECGAEFHEVIQKENRFTSKLEYRYATLPSYTQLGMAALLPHNALSFADNYEDVLSGGQNTQGLDARKRILIANSNTRSTAIGAENLMAMPREWNKEYDLVYVYHNRIDKTGDDKTSEDKVIDAVREEITYLKALVKKIFNMNGTNIIITADHGFIYQNEAIPESDFADTSISGDIYNFNRRFVIGNKLVYKNNVKHYTADQLGIDSQAEVLIPKGINRLRLQGSGSRFVHGGASLQELVVPVINIYKKREDTVSKVAVDILNKSSNNISTNLQGVQFYQTKPTGEQVIGRTIKAWFKTESGEAISEVFNFTFDSSSVNATDREKYHGFQISSKASTQYRNQTVYLVMEEMIEGTSTWIEYQKYPYTVNISFTNDFDGI